MLKFPTIFSGKTNKRIKVSKPLPSPHGRQVSKKRHTKLKEAIEIAAFAVVCLEVIFLGALFE